MQPPNGISEGKANRRLGTWLSRWTETPVLFGAFAAFVLTTSHCAADTIRVTSWNLGLEPETETTTAAIEEAASTLKTLNPDVILLQSVKDWRMCERLATALKPLQYHVVMCSAFHGISPGATGQPQVAIFSKTKAYFTWADSWAAARQGTVYGAGFAAIDVGTQRLGFFTALFGNQQTGEQLARRVLQQIQTVAHWETNQVQTFVVAASSGLGARNPSRVLRKSSSFFEKMGLIDATASLPPDVRATLRTSNGPERLLGDCVFAGPAGVPSSTRVTASQVPDHYPITSDIELDPAKVSLALDIRSEARREQNARTRVLVRDASCWGGGAVALALLATVLMRRRRLKRASAPAPRLPGLPLRVSPKSTPQVRPIILAERPKPTPVSHDSSPLARSPLRPILRVQPKAGPTPPLEDSQTAPPPPLPEATAPQEPQTGGNQGPVAMLAQHSAALQNPVLTRDPEVREGVIKELSGWLKQRLVGKLISDRAQLLQAQQLATQMASTLDHRLGRIEAQIQQQNQAYVRRIEDLNRELAAAREENRELIRERIAQVKAEMEAARAKVLAEADFDVNKLRL
jgi:hypothetical protein